MFRSWSRVGARARGRDKFKAGVRLKKLVRAKVRTRNIKPCQGKGQSQNLGFKLPKRQHDQSIFLTLHQLVPNAEVVVMWGQCGGKMPGYA